MARIYAGELTRIDVDVLERLQQELPDDFYVFAEVNVGRNVDVFVIRPMGSRPAVMVAAELKRVFRPLKGSTDGVWKEKGADGVWRTISPSNRQDINHHWQSVNATNALRRWLWLNQSRFRSSKSSVPGSQMRAWPHLVLYGLPREAHELPDGPITRFGEWFFNVGAWIDSLSRQKAYEGMPVSDQEIERLIEALGLLSLPDQTSLRALSEHRAADAVTDALRDLQRRVLALEAELHMAANATAA